MVVNFGLFLLSVIALVGSAISSMMASFNIGTIVSLSVLSFVSILSVSYVVGSIFMGYTLMHLKESTQERREAQDMKQKHEGGTTNGAGEIPIASSEAGRAGGAIREAPAIEDGGRGNRVAPE